ncbi:RNA-directed DNA polymerase from mobile element jockey-like protein [Willisornis vidua]|uniref:RNA-directed DNA polymerase from mobile element jockey-like protein n=1 Tax=Willisornis vidua TaxID=1566151 RepID=A0ABQ9CUV6_9PASS|nr:RNA-directed DNA polymerase from mobile element jockey-like protein [Willisornis vidua]
MIGVLLWGGYKLFRKGRQGRRSGGVALYIRDYLDSVEVEVINNKVECLWTRIRGKAKKKDILVGVCYRPHNQDDEGDELFYKQLADVSRLAAFVLVRDFNLPDICWELNTAEKRQSRRFLECIEDNFLLHLVNEPTRDNKKHFYKYINNKRRGKESLHSLLDSRGNIVNWEEEKVEVLNTYFASVFTNKTGGPQDNGPLELIDNDRKLNKPLKFQEDTVSDILKHLDPQKSMGPDGIHSRVMRELVEEFAKPLSIIYQQSWPSGEVPGDWKWANVTPIHKNGCKEDPGNYRPVSLTSLPGRVMEQIVLTTITQNLQDGQGLRPSQYRFRKGRSCLTNLITFYDQVTHLVDEGKAVDVVYLDFSKAFDTFSHNILLEKLVAHGLDKRTLCWVKSWLDVRAQRVLAHIRYWKAAMRSPCNLLFSKMVNGDF